MGRKKRTKVEEPAAPPPATASTVPTPSMMPPPPPISGSAAAAVVAPDIHRPVDPRLRPHQQPSPVDPRQQQQQQQGTPASSSAGDHHDDTVHIKSATIAKGGAMVDGAGLVDEADLGTKPSSMYGLHSHSGDLVEDDVYVSDGSIDSDDEEEEEGGDDVATGENGGDGEGANKGGDKATKKAHNQTELVITNSKMGLMRRGGLSSLLGQPLNRTWVRSATAASGEATTAEGGDANHQTTTQGSGEGANNIKTEEEEITDPAILFAIQQRKIEEAKQAARILESSENAGRDPCLFSKRTAFDIRMDQIEDKPWDKPSLGAPGGGGGADATDYFNYGLTEEDWMEYAERQLAVRQELTDASKQKRLPDPGIVPVIPRAPSKQGDRVAVRVKVADENTKEEDDDVDMDDASDSDEEEGGVELGVELGPLADRVKEDADKEKKAAETKEANALKKEQDEAAHVKKYENIVGGAWGAGAAADSVLTRLIQEQSGDGGMGGPPMGMPPHPGMLPPNNMAPPNNSMPPMMHHPPPPPSHMGVNMSIPPPHVGHPLNPNQHHGGGNPVQRDNRHINMPPLHHERGGGGGNFHNQQRDQFQQHQQQHPPHQQQRPQFQQQQRGGGNLHNQQRDHFQGGHHQQPNPHHGGNNMHHGNGPPQGRGGGQGGHFGGRGGGGGRGYPGGMPPGGPGGWDGRKRPRSEFGDPRGDARRGRW
mmetsp:Transcript_21919/g.47498  ORF Transcript_21919/g.47498 Transcript_21919/m.47498 type:complete len:707 (-) Transcript_21919:96-2216(-)